MQIRRYELSLTFSEPLLGAVPRDREVYATYIASKAPQTADIAAETESIAETEHQSWTGFHSDETGLFLLDYAVKGFIKEAGNLLKDALGLRALRAKLDNVLFVKPRRVYLRRGDAVLRQPDGVLERPLRGLTPQGPRVSLVRSDYVAAGSSLACRLEVLTLPKLQIDEPLLRELFDYGAYKGLGQFRNGGYGRFSYTLNASD